MDLEILGYNDSRTLEKRRHQILSASRELLIEKSIEQTSMQIIAEKSGITRRSLYNYYESKEKIAVDIQILILTEINFLKTWGPIIFYNDLPALLEKMPEITAQALGKFNKHYVLINRFDSHFNKGYPDSKYIDFIRNEAQRIFSINTEEFHPENFRSEWLQSNLLITYIQRLSIRNLNQSLTVDDALEEVGLLCKVISSSVQ